MKWIKYFENFNQNKYDEIIRCIKNSGYVWATIVKNFPDNNPSEPLKPLSIDEDGLVTAEYDNKKYEIDLNDIEKIKY